MNYQMTFFELTHTRKTDPVQCAVAAKKTEKVLSRRKQEALEAFRSRPGLTRKQWRQYDPEEHFCKRARDLQRDGLVYFEQDTETSEFRIYAK